MKTIELARETVKAMDTRLQQLEQQLQSIVSEMQALTASRNSWKTAIDEDEKTNASRETDSHT